MSGARFPEQLAKARDLAGLTQRQLAARAGTSSASVCRWEGGAIRPKKDNVQLLDDATGSRGRLLRAWLDDREGGGIPAYMRDLGRLEEMAHTIELVSPHLVPGIFQSPAYARLVFSEGLMGDPRSKSLNRLVALRCSRYDQLCRLNDPRITVVFPEAALTFIPESVRKEQARHLLEVIAGERVRVHVVPLGALLLGVTSMTLVFHMENGEIAVSSDHVDGNVIYEDPKCYIRLQGLVKQALGAALPAEQSRMVLEKLQ